MIKNRSQAAFTLIEVMITLSILMTMVFAVSQLIKASFDMKRALSQKSRVTQRLDVAMNTIVRDLSGAFIVNSKDSVRDSGKKRTIFRITKGDSDAISFTYVGHRAINENMKESDISYVTYEVKESKAEPGRKSLYRGETPRVPKDFNEPPRMFLLAEDIASVQFEAWNGDSFSKERWDSTMSDTKDHLPHMVRVSLQSWEESQEERLGKDVKPSVQYTTVVFLPYALEFKEIKSPTASYSLFK